ncbi:MAG TPA: hypothetical protein VGL62_07150 [Vicinamibacterales bacterium]|jgi:hypothetical protein
MRVWRLGAGVLCIAASAALAGCFQSSTIVKLQTDGSGTIEETLTMNTQAMSQLSAFAAMGNNGKGDASAPKEVLSEADARAGAAKLGTGVTYVSSEKIQNADVTGRKVIYAFKDIRQLSIQEVNSPSHLGDGSVSSTDAPMTFKLQQLPDGHSVLTIDNTAASKGSGIPGSDNNRNGAQAAQMMKVLFHGLKINVEIRVGRLIRTNIPYVAGNTVTLLGIDFDQLLANPDAFDRLTNAKTPADTRAAIKQANGVKVNLDPQLTIEFASR